MVLSDFPVLSANSFWVTLGFCWMTCNTAISSKVQSKVPIWHFETSALTL